MSYNNGLKTFTAGEALTDKSRVKIESGTVTDPPEVVDAGAGEQHIGTVVGSVSDGEKVTIKMRTAPGTVEGVAAGAFARGATLYGAADGKIDDASSGTAIGIAIEAATADGDEVEWADFTVISTTAATVSIADAGGYTAEVTVEAALQEIYLHQQSAQNFIPVPLEALYEGDATNLVAKLGIATTPTIDMANGDTDSGIVVTWAASNSDPVLFQVPLPPNFDTSADMVIHFRAKSGGATDTPTFGIDTYFNEGDTKISDTSSALGAAYAEETVTIANADIPAGAQTVTVEMTPGAHTTDTAIISAIWIEFTGTTLT